MALRIFKRLRDLLDVDVHAVADGDALVWDEGAEMWVPGAGGGGGGAPTDVNYLVGTADSGLSAEIVVGTTPGGELGGTWASPTVDATHSGSSHASVQAAAEATAAGALSTHSADTTGVHGIADTSSLVLTGDSRLSDARTPTGSAGGVLGGTYPNPSFASDMATQAELDAHINDTSAAHAASAVSVSSATLSGTGTDVQASLEEIDNLLDDHSARHEDGGADEISIAGLSGTPAALQSHLDDTSDAHDASAISVLDTNGDYTATDVEGVLAEIAPQLGGGGAVEFIQEVIVGAGGSAAVDFTSIPGSYRHLRIIGMVQTENAAAQNFQIRFNNDSGSNYSYEGFFAFTTNVGAAGAAGQTFSICAVAAETGSSFPVAFTIDIPYYAATSFTKTFTSDAGGHYGTNGQRNGWSGTWNNTAAITRITLFSGGSSDIKEGSMISLYGVT